jgi:hypothetical protein
VADGWIAAINFREFIFDEWKKYNIDYYIIFGGNLQIDHWRTLKPPRFFEIVNNAISKRIDLI